MFKLNNYLLALMKLIVGQSATHLNENTADSGNVIKQTVLKRLVSWEKYVRDFSYISLLAQVILV